jgi:4-hydroxybutyrate CoA-transferase
MMDEKRGDFQVVGLYAAADVEFMKPIDAYLIQVGEPDEHGYCSLGASCWNKRELCKKAKHVLAEVNKRNVRTYGENYVHVSEIDCFVEHTPSERLPGGTDLLGRKVSGPGELEKTVAGYIGELVPDGACLEIGVGGTAEWVARLGVLDNKVNLGWHSENTPRGVATLVKNGVINGKRKQINVGKAVATAVGGGSKDEMDYINMNPQFEVYPSSYCLNPKVISENDNVVAINSAIMVDLTGQISAESIGTKMMSGAGGQTSFAIGAYLSNGGRAITAIPSTAQGGKTSRIVAQLTPGTVVSTPRTLADTIVTEYGVAKLKGKTQRERAMELIGVAHPDFRAELEKEAKRLYWPE